MPRLQKRRFSRPLCWFSLLVVCIVCVQLALFPSQMDAYGTCKNWEAKIESYCFSINNCDSCVTVLTENEFSAGVCGWCPLDRRCHFSNITFTNPCPADMNIKYDSDCPPRDEMYGTYDKDLAYEQVLLSAVAYSDEPFKCMDHIKSTKDDSEFDFEVLRLIGEQCHHFTFKYNITFKPNITCAAVVSLSHSRKSIYVSFRGTHSIPWQLIHQGLSVVFEEKSNIGNGEAQKYFHKTFHNLEPNLTWVIKKFKEEYTDYMVRFSGHSLGGALASVAAFSYVKDGTLLKDEVSLYTYGMPRVGDIEFVVEHDRRLNNSFRVVNNKDCIAHVPACMLSCGTKKSPYHHRTEIFYDTDGMHHGSSYTVCHSNEDTNCSHRPYVAFTDILLKPIKCYQDHTTYFNISIGSYCDSFIGRDRTRNNQLRYYLRSSELTILGNAEDVCTGFLWDDRSEAGADDTFSFYEELLLHPHFRVIYTEHCN